MKPEWLNRELHVLSSYYALCTSEKMFHKELRRLGVKKHQRPDFLSTRSANATAHFFDIDGKVCCIVCLGDISKRDVVEVYGVLIHEAVHIWQQHAEDIGEKNPASEEEAYAVQRIAQSLIAEYMRQTKRSKK